MSEKVFDLDDRLIKFAEGVTAIIGLFPQSSSARNIASQLARCGTAPCLQYSEAQSAESRKDFIHKMKVALKELRETFTALKLAKLKGWCPNDKLEPLLAENNELISIFVTSIKTAQRNMEAENKRKGGAS